jgi:hypothetical protein
LIFLFCPETAYQRAEDLNIDLGTVDYTKEETENTLSQDVKHLEEAQEPPWTFVQQLRLWRGIESPENIFKIIVRPLPLLLFPQVMYSFITALSTGWLSVLINVTSLIYGSEPYNLTIIQIGLLGIGALVASLLGFSAGPLNDYLCKFMARRNKGIYEPEVYPILFRITKVPTGNYRNYLRGGVYWILWIRDMFAL